MNTENSSFFQKYRDLSVVILTVHFFYSIYYVILYSLSFYLFLMTLVFATLTHSVTAFLPGKNPHGFYICLGHCPAGLADQKIKRNFVSNFVYLITILVHTFIGLRLKWFQYLEKRKDENQQPNITYDFIYLKACFLIQII